jgi:hypothetical protein
VYFAFILPVATRVSGAFRRQEAYIQALSALAVACCGHALEFSYETLPAFDDAHGEHGLSAEHIRPAAAI